MDLDGPWGRITTWLTTHAPTSAADIRPPAPAADLEAARAAFDRPWPRDLVRLYELCDGTGEKWDGAMVLPMMTLVPLAQMLASREVNLDVAADFHDGDELAAFDAAPAGPAIDAWLPSLVPFAEDGGGDGLVVDLRGGPGHGAVGRWMHADVSTGAAWPSLTVLFDEVADALERGAVFDGWIPQVDAEGRLDWDVARG